MEERQIFYILGTGTEDGNKNREGKPVIPAGGGRRAGLRHKALVRSRERIKKKRKRGWRDRSEVKSTACYFQRS